MNGAVLVVGGIVYFVAAYFLYGRYLVRHFGVDPERPTPANAQADGVDYVAAKPPVLFGHHFASIAGAGPIVGPVMAAHFGWIPAALWILLGSVFIGAFHDFAALFLSVRDQGRSIGHVIENLVGYAGRQVFLIFSWAVLVLVVAMFGILVAKTFVTTPAVATASLLFIAMAPVFGWLVYRKNVSILAGSLIFVPLLFLFVWLGTVYPCDLSGYVKNPQDIERIWICVLLVYVFVASVIPVWMLLQPRDYLNSYLLYAMMILGFVGVVLVAPRFGMPAFAGFVAKTPKGEAQWLFPLLFVTIACGACSGFHSLVSSGTTAKQVANERHILPIGYGGMLVEGVLALLALVSVAYLTPANFGETMKGGAVGAFAGGLATFAENGFGLSFDIGKTFVALAISAFMLTTLDTATRLARFAWQELFLPRAGSGQTPARPVKILANPGVATLISVGGAATLAFSGGGGAIWPVFGASNQLLAALTLLALTLYLLRRKKNFWLALLPMAFMMTITIWALFLLMMANWGKNPALFLASEFLLVMALVLVVLAAMSVGKAKRGEQA
ncbi:MAG: carbon starvation protein A [Lentisphaeria bacterium]|jgi:carbon starvation protein|nr:carbon starvation protein A [Lentisphaeria bacterium]